MFSVRSPMEGQRVRGGGQKVTGNRTPGEAAAFCDPDTEEIDVAHRCLLLQHLKDQFVQVLRRPGSRKRQDSPINDTLKCTLSFQSSCERTLHLGSVSN